MKNGFADGFADFLEDRLGKALFTLREKDEDYRKLSDEYAALLNGAYQTADDYQQAMLKITDVGQKLGDFEKHYLFLAGMREHARMESALSSDEFEKLFVG